MATDASSLPRLLHGASQKRKARVSQGIWRQTAYVLLSLMQRDKMPEVAHQQRRGGYDTLAKP